MLKRILSRPDNTKMITFFYFALVIYAIAALVWWGLLLYRQNNQIMQLQQQTLELKQKNAMPFSAYLQEANGIAREKKLHNLQYIGEGGTFLVIILLGAVFVFHAMRRQIRFGRQQQNFMAAVTHELKSPIAIIQLNLETLQKHTLEEDQRKKLYENNLSEISRLNQLCNNMLLASQFDNRQYHLVKEEINLSELMKEIVKESVSRMHHHIISSDIADGIIITADKFMLEIAVNNLLVNAAKYAPRQSLIHIGLLSVAHSAKIRIADEGEGIPPRERDRIFSRFYRIGNENTRKAKGTGLGLFLTKKIIEQHKGSIAVMDNTPKGSIFEIALPLTFK
ncbi:MAG: sensor histidine kinase [Chitinophagaceae bacterium]